MIADCGRFWGVLAALAMGLAGCASRGNEVLKAQDTSTVNLSIIDGQTTRDEVQRIYGSPAQTSFLSEKNEVWIYRWERATAQGQNFIPIVGAFVRGFDVRKKELVVIFNERNVVARHTMTDNNDSVKTGLIDPGPAAPLGGGSVTSPPALPAPIPSTVSPATSPPATSSTPASTAPAATSPASSGAPGAAVSPVSPAPVAGLSRSRL
jgi:outer membrane protein assembly factor BamE (lipoprotein component of BamABCDE complex)